MMKMTWENQILGVGDSLVGEDIVFKVFFVIENFPSFVR